MNRRRLFGSLLALLAAPVAFARRLPRLYGDGVHDDTEAFQALLNSESVQMPDGTISGHYTRSGPMIEIPPVNFRIGSRITMSNCQVINSRPPRVQCL